MDTIAKHNIVVMALLTQTEAQKQKEIQEQKDQSEGSNSRESSEAEKQLAGVKLGSKAVKDGSGKQTTQWRVEWDYSLHKFFPIMKLNK